MSKGNDRMKIDIKQTVKKYYGEELQGTSDLKTNACCALDAFPDYIRKIIPLLNDEIITKSYGCGSPIPLYIEGMKVLDVGCGMGNFLEICKTHHHANTACYRSGIGNNPICPCSNIISS